MSAKVHMLAPARSEAVTPLLKFLAGEFAEDVSRVWRAPFGEFYTLPSPRRHAAAIALAGLSRRALDDAELRRQLAFERDPLIAKMLVGELARGFMRSLAKAGEQLWSRREYVEFLDLFSEPMANEVLRHMKVVEPAYFMPLALLPAPLRLAPIVRVVKTEHAARDLGRAFQLAVRMRQSGCEARLARKWGAGGEAHTLFARATADLMPDEFRPPSPAPRLGVPFMRIVRRAQLEKVGREFRNCLADQAGRIAEGRMAVYIWRTQPAAAIALNWDAAGWRLAEAKGHANVDLEEDQLRDLVRIIGRHGVRTGPSVESLVGALHSHARGDPVYRTPEPDFGELLELGDLWS